MERGVQRVSRAVRRGRSRSIVRRLGTSGILKGGGWVGNMSERGNVRGNMGWGDIN
jgi:hypothetical protein